MGGGGGGGYESTHNVSVEFVAWDVVRCCQSCQTLLSSLHYNDIKVDIKSKNLC